MKSIHSSYSDVVSIHSHHNITYIPLVNELSKLKEGIAKGDLRNIIPNSSLIVALYIVVPLAISMNMNEKLMKTTKQAVGLLYSLLAMNMVTLNLNSLASRTL